MTDTAGSDPVLRNLTRNNANFEIRGNYEVKKAAPLDNRMCVPYRDQLISEDWVAYKGMICEVTEDGDYNGLYELTDTDYKTMSNWRRVTSYRPSQYLLDPSNENYNIVQNVGGFNSDFGWTPQFLNDYTYDQLFDILLFPIRLSIKENPIVNIEVTPSGDTYDPENSLFQVNDSVTFNMNVYITGNKVTLVGKELMNPYSGDISSVYYVHFNGLTYDLSFDGHHIDPISFTHTISHGDQSLNVYITYKDGTFKPFDSNSVYDTSSTDYTYNGGIYRGPSGEYLSETHVGSTTITGIYPVYTNNSEDSWVPLSETYGITDTIYFESDFRITSSNPFKFAISESKYNTISGDLMKIKFEEDIDFDNNYKQDGCKFYVQHDTTNLSTNMTSIDDVSYMVFNTQCTLPFGTVSSLPIKYKFSVEP
tara:strand:+ start:6268 stop:7533 length:1266 start_codon:yes stop_codon:yes gene_type:complete